MNTDREVLEGLFIEVAGTNLEFRTVSVPNGTLTGRQILSFCDAAPIDDFVLVRWLPEGDLAEIREDEPVEIQNHFRAKFIVAKADRLFRFMLNDRQLIWPASHITEAVLRTLGKIPPTDSLFLRRESGEEKPIEPGEAISLAEAGVEHVFSKPEIWKLNVQGVTIESHEPSIVVRQALIKAHFNPDQGWIIVLKAGDTKRQVSLEDVIDLTTPGIEKLRLIPKEINNGEAVQLRRDFSLLSTDESGLTDSGLKWETIVDRGRRWLILKEFKLPAGYTTSTTNIAVEVPGSYPTAELDMFYCSPPLSQLNGAAIPQTQASETIEGQHFQRWSRHRGPGSQWRPGQDNVITHLALIEAALLREVEQ